MKVQHFYDTKTNTLTYIVFDSQSLDAIIIDPVLDYDPASGKIEDTCLQKISEFISKHQLRPLYCLETHAHADHLSSSQFLKKMYPEIRIAISEKITFVQKTFSSLLQIEGHVAVDGSQFDKLIKDDETFNAGTITIKALATPGHTPACLSFLINHYVFTGDALFVDDSGTGRCDFPEGSAKELYHSIQKILYQLPNETIVFVGHDYQPLNRNLKFETTIGSAKLHNIHLLQSTSEESYIDFREKRDLTLGAPRLLFQSIQVNINAGILPKFLKLPLFMKFK